MSIVPAKMVVCLLGEPDELAEMLAALEQVRLALVERTEAEIEHRCAAFAARHGYW